MDPEKRDTCAWWRLNEAENCGKKEMEIISDRKLDLEAGENLTYRDLKAQLSDSLEDRSF